MEGAASTTEGLVPQPGAPSVLSHSQTPSLSSTPQPQSRPSPTNINGDHQTTQSKHGNNNAEMINPLSQTVTATTSGSSLSSVKEEDLSGAAPYETRSRNRSGARPNYADEVDMDVDFAMSKADTPSYKRSTPSEITSGFRAINGTAQGTSKPSNLPELPNPSIEVNKTSPLSTPNGHPEKKKRKYERANGVKTATDGRHVARDSIPGTSQFFLQHDGTPEPPVSKKRRTADGSLTSITAPVTSAVATPVSRKSSTSHATRAGRETCLVTFEKSRGHLKNGTLEADDGSTFAINGKTYDPGIHLHCTTICNTSDLLADIFQITCILFANPLVSLTTCVELWNSVEQTWRTNVHRSRLCWLTGSTDQRTSSVSTMTSGICMPRCSLMKHR